ncbi:MAG: hypothetical protein H6Q69_4292 [Firmicutes bacterium]|nr:hypothetical protein [Bacillota bacterium]
MYTESLKYFMAVAKHLNFTKAATELYMAQPALSLKISQLENELGVELFKRTKRKVELTAAGYVLMAEGNKLSEKILDVKNKVKQAEEYRDGYLKVGILGAIAPDFLPVIQEFRSQYPLIHLAPCTMTMKQIHTELLNQVIDTVITVETNIFNISDLAVSYLYHEGLSLIVPENHRFVQNGIFDFSLLAEETFLMFSYEESPHYYQHLINLCATWGFYPKICRQLSTIDDLLFFIAAGYGVAITPTHIQTYISAKLKLRLIPLKNQNDFLSVVIAWNKNNHNPAVSLFYQLLTIN